MSFKAYVPNIESLKDRVWIFISVWDVTHKTLGLVRSCRSCAFLDNRPLLMWRLSRRRGHEVEVDAEARALWASTLNEIIRARLGEVIRGRIVNGAAFRFADIALTQDDAAKPIEFLPADAKRLEDLPIECQAEILHTAKGEAREHIRSFFITEEAEQLKRMTE